ncbi:hypothetical protein [Streptomyces boncukensis]|uniref:Uncharacterized protein n=1 Tax=Streptomyces boncukensis TaxID=2711219 RepID=A0A6G4WTI3_9ACTN|nr:hypothetical protein [Streptomyces boncukensis]NGO67854.1 hypothetical protein [Streptomyces boncukensis]
MSARVRAGGPFDRREGFGEGSADEVPGYARPILDTDTVRALSRVCPNGARPDQAAAGRWPYGRVLLAVRAVSVVHVGPIGSGKSMAAQARVVLAR